MSAWNSHSRWTVVELDPDATGAGSGGKNADVTFYAVGSRREGEELAARINEQFMQAVYGWGGYPGSAWVVDLAQPDAYANTEQKRAELDEWEEEFGEEGEG